MNSTTVVLKPTPHFGRRIVRLLRIGIALATLLLLTGVVTAIAALIFTARFSGFDDVEAASLAGAIEQVTLSEIGESPHFEANSVTGPIPICDDVPEQLIKPLRRAFGLMRGTEEGARLFEALIDSGVCVSVDDLTYNAGYAYTREIGPGDWSSSRIVVDRSLVRSSATDTLAALLVHEATHIDRAVSGQACFVSDQCERLPNGVEIDEEIAAHAAEAEWWIAAFGSDGKRFAFRSDYGENRLARAYLQGEDAFRRFVMAYRGDPREGDGI
jgi:hypothetical protein